MTRKRGVFYFRRRVPFEHGAEIALSLRTRNFRRAEFLLANLNALFIRALNAPSMDKKNISTILRDHLNTLLAEDIRQFIAAPSGRTLYTTAQPYDDPIDADCDVIEDLLWDDREALARRDVRRVAGEADELLKVHGLDPAQKIELALGLLQVRIKRMEKVYDLLRGRDGPVSLDPSHGDTASIQPETNINPTQNFSEVLPAFLESMNLDAGWSGQTMAQSKTTFRMFVEVCGDKPVSAYKRVDFARFKETLRKLPANYSKARQWRGRSLFDIAESASGDGSVRLTMKTIKRHFAALGRFFNHLIQNGVIEGDNPAYGFEFPMNGRANSKRQMWQGEKLVKLFDSPVWKGSHWYYRAKPGAQIIKDEKFWLPLLGLYHGNRLEELAQLRREDVMCADGLSYFDINDEGARHVKNAASVRHVPIHPTIISLGFLDYVKETAPGPTDLVFPELSPSGPDAKLGHGFTKWWTRYRTQIGVYEPGLDYHSFRHGVTTKLVAGGVSQAIIDELTGHEGQGTSRTVYTKSLPLKVLHDAISKVEWPELSHPGSSGVNLADHAKISRTHAVYPLATKNEERRQ